MLDYMFELGGLRSARRLFALLATCLMVLAVCLWAAVRPAAAETPPHTDVMLLFDTSGSMGDELEEAKKEIEKVEGEVRASLPDVEFGVANVEDFPFSEEEETTETPWRLDLALTPNAVAVHEAIGALSIGNGGDEPESYGRALWETDTNPNVGWRAGARHIIILVADNVPHDNELNEGLPESVWIGNPFNTGEERLGTWHIPGTLFTESTNRDFQTTMKELAKDGKPLGMVDFRGSETGYLPYWQYWAGLTGGEALLGGEGELAAKLTTLIETRAGAALPACPTVGEIRNAAGVCFAPHPTTTQVICNLVIATATDTCTATVGDGAPAGASNPTGKVTFATKNGGLFIAGNTCTLTPTPLSGNVSSCSVQFLPPTAPAKFPEIVATYSGDELRLASVGETHYGPASSLADHVDLSEAGTVKPDGTVEIPTECEFPCEIEGGLYNLPDFATLTSVANPLGAESSSVTATISAKHKGKKKKKKPVLLGKGKVKLSKANKKGKFAGKLVLKPTAKGRHALRGVHGKGVRLTVKFTIKTINGHVKVATKTVHVKVRPAKKKHSKHH